MRISTYLYPWDLAGDPRGVDAVQRVGADAVNLAAVYHGVRAATPRHPQHRVVAFPGGSFVPVSGDRPPWPAREWDGAFAVARDSARSAGLQVRAWAVLAHRDGAGLAAPDWCVRSAFGDRYDYALCPARPEVRRALVEVARAAASADVDGIVLEACGQPGVEHGDLHDKTAGAGWSRADRELLSVCVCDACTERLSSHGVDAGALASRIRSAVGRGAGSAAEVLGDDAEIVLRLRSDDASEIIAGSIDAARDAGVDEVMVRATADPWATGPDVPLAADPGASVIAGCWRPGELDELLTLGEVAADVAAVVDILEPDDSLAPHVAALADARELQLYHAGLASDAALDAAGHAVRTLMERTPR